MVRSDRTDGNIFLRILIGVFTVLLILMCSFGASVYVNRKFGQPLIEN